MLFFDSVLTIYVKHDVSRTLRGVAKEELNTTGFIWSLAVIPHMPWLFRFLDEIKLNVEIRKV